MKTKAEQCKEEGNKCMKEGKYTEAVLHYTEAIKHEPNSAVLHSNRALAFMKIDQLFLAMEDAEETIRLEPSWPKGFFRKGGIEFKAGQYNKALLSYKQALLLDPGDEGVMAAVSKTNKEIAKETKDAAQKPLIYSCVGLAVGVMIVAADHYFASKPVLQHPILQVLLVLGCGGVGCVVAKIHRFLINSQKKALLEEPLDLLKEIGAETGGQVNSRSPSSSQSFKQTSSRRRVHKEK